MCQFATNGIHTLKTTPIASAKKTQTQVGNPNQSIDKIEMTRKWEKLAYSYIRFSTPGQINGDSIRRQTERSEKYAKEHGLRIDHSLKLQDLGISAFRGKNSSEGALAGFLQAIQTGRVAPGSTLLVESLDRLSRNTVTAALGQFMHIISAGITVVTIMDGMIYNQEALDKNPGNLMCSIVIMMRAHEESASRSDRISQSMIARRRRAAEEKRPITSWCPSWLRLEKSGNLRQFQIIPERAALVQRIFEMIADGAGRRSVAKVFNHEKIPCWGTGHGWHDSYIAKIFHSEAVLGRFQPHRLNSFRKRVPDGEIIENYYPAVITPVLWQRAHSRPAAPTGPRPRKIANLFSGLVIDGYTGEKMLFSDKGTANSKRPRGDGRYLYSDIGRLSPGQKGQTWPYAHFELAMLKFLTGLDWQSLLKRESNEELAAWRKKEAELVNHAALKRKGIQRLLDIFATNELPDELIGATKQKATAMATELKEIEAALEEVRENIEKSEGAVQSFTEGINEFKMLVSSGSSSERMRLQTELRRRIKTITLFRHGTPIINGEPIPNIQLPFIIVEFTNGEKRQILTRIPKHKPSAQTQPRGIGGRFIPKPIGSRTIVAEIPKSYDIKLPPWFRQLVRETRTVSLAKNSGELHDAG